MQSNCYIIVDDELKHCFVVDPASEKSLREIAFINDAHLLLDYIILTHEHTDHTWGVNALLERFNPIVICSADCKKFLPKECLAYFSFYYDDPNYEYRVARIDYTTEELGNQLIWNNRVIHFFNTPGHSYGSICISISDKLFTGDTIMLYKPYIHPKRGSMSQYKESVVRILAMFNQKTIIYPGHGDPFEIEQYVND